LAWRCGGRRGRAVGPGLDVLGCRIAHCNCKEKAERRRGGRRG
jgi:hypothetical protein